MDTITLGSLIGLLVFGYLYHKASGKVWYMDADDDPVSFKSIFALLWWVCLVVLLMKFFKS